VIVGAMAQLHRSSQRQLAGLAERAQAEIPAELVGAEFEAEGTLLGLSQRRTGAGLELTLLWRPASGASRTPFVHLCGNEEAIVGYAEPRVHSLELEDLGTVRVAIVTLCTRCHGHRKYGPPGPTTWTCGYT